MKDENDIFQTSATDLPKYLKTMDRKRQTFFRGAHPTRYQADAVSLATTVRSKSLAGAGRNIAEKQSVAASEKS